jgi:hypothetical protein
MAIWWLSFHSTYATQMKTHMFAHWRTETDDVAESYGHSYVISVVVWLFIAKAH